MTVAAVVLKKIWLLINTIGGVDLFECPLKLEEDEKIELSQKAFNNPLFTFNLAKLNLYSKNIIKNID